MDPNHIREQVKIKINTFKEEFHLGHVILLSNCRFSIVSLDILLKNVAAISRASNT
jgi:hypothetical protein